MIVDSRMLLILVFLTIECRCDEILQCFACGFESVDPELDKPGSYGDFRKDNSLKDKKMYNHTCDIADAMGLDNKWVRPCPSGTKSCFIAKAQFHSQAPLFRGCADTLYQFDEECFKELVAVDVVVGVDSVDVEVINCWCNSDRCNAQASSAIRFLANHSAILIVLTTIFITHSATNNP